MNKERQIKGRMKSRFPEKVIGPELKASGTEVAIESVEIQHEGLVVESDDEKKQ